MQKFKYRFEGIKKVKENLEKKVQKEISLLDLEIESLSERRLEVLRKKENSRREWSSRNSFKISELQFQEQFEQLLDIQAEKIMHQIGALERNREIKTEDLAQKSKENKVFEKLKEKHFEQFLIEENQLEQKEIDEIASKQFSREA